MFYSSIIINIMKPIQKVGLILLNISLACSSITTITIKTQKFNQPEKSKQL